MKVSVALSLPPTANITTEELQLPEVKSGLESQLATAIGIDVQYVTITAIYICPDDARCVENQRRLTRANGRGRGRRAIVTRKTKDGQARMLSSDTEKRIVVEFVLSATEEIIQAAETMMSDTSTFTETLSDGASTSLSSTLNKKVQVEASAPITLERVVGKKIVEEDMDGTSNVPEGDGGSAMPDWFLPIVITAGSLILVLVIGGLIMQRRARNKLSKSIQPFNSDDLDDAKEISSRGDSDRKR